MAKSGRERGFSEPGFVIDSTSDDSDSSHGSSGSPASEEDFFITEMCKPMISMMAPLTKDKTKKFVFDVTAGLCGTETLHQYPCILDETTRRFFVWLGDTDFALFSKSTFMNLSNFAEEAGARSMTFLVFRQHRHKAQYRNMFSVIDAKRLGSEAVKELVGAVDRQAAKTVLANTLFYELAL